MNQPQLIAVVVLVLLTVICGLVGILVPRMRRIYWILGLSLVLVEFGGIAIGIALSGVRHGHLTSKGFFSLLINSYAAWFVFQHLVEKIREPSYKDPMDSN